MAELLLEVQQGAKTISKFRSEFFTGLDKKIILNKRF